MSKRVEFLDFLKLLAILMVVFTHVFETRIEGAYSTPLYNIIWLVQMPLFMSVSGWLASNMKKVDSAQKLGKSIGKKTLVYVYPCVTYIILMSIFQYIRTGVYSDIFNKFIMFFLDPEIGLWFLWVLWLISVVFDLGNYLASKFRFTHRDILVPYLLLLIAALLIAIFVLLGMFDGKIFGLRLFSFYTIFYLEGNLLKKIHDSVFLQSFKPYSILKWLLFWICLAIFLFDIFYFKSIFAFSDRSLLYIAIRVIGSSATCYWLFVAAEKACHAHFFKQISKGGRFTLECYYFHFFFIALIPDISEFSPELKWCFVCLYFLAVVVSVAAMIGIVYFIPYLHLLLFGKDWGKFHPIPKK